VLALVPLRWASTFAASDVRIADVVPFDIKGAVNVLFVKVCVAVRVDTVDPAQLINAPTAKLFVLTDKNDATPDELTDQVVDSPEVYPTFVKTTLSEVLSDWLNGFPAVGFEGTHAVPFQLATWPVVAADCVN